MPLVDVPGHGTVEFPEEMAPEEMDKAIRDTWPDLTGPSRKESLLAEQAKLQAEPEPSTLKEFFAATGEPFVPIPKPEAPEDAGFIRKAATGLARSAIGAVEGLESPATAVLGAAAAIPVIGKPMAIAAGAGIGTHTAMESGPAFYAAVKRGDVQGAAEAAGNFLVGSLLIGGGIKATMAGEVPVVATKLAPVTAKAFKETVGETETFTETPPALPQDTPVPTPPSPTLALLTAIAAKEGDIPVTEAKPTEATPVEAKPVESPIPEGPGAATTGFGTKSELEQLTDVVKGMENSSIPVKEQFKASLDASMNGAKDISEAALGTAKGTYAYLKNKLVGPPGFTEWKRGVNRWNAEDQLSARSAYHFAKETAKVIPQPARQAAVSKWIDAGGDMAILQYGESVTKPEFKQAYRDAQNLTPEELNLAKNVQNYFDAKLQDAIDNGLIEAGLDNYIHRIYPKENLARNNASAMINAGVLQPNPALIRKRLFQFDYEAEASGMSPVQGFADRILSYDQAFNRALSARSFIKWLQTVHKEKDGMPSVDISGSGKELTDPVTGAPSGVLITPHTNRAVAKDGRPYIQYDHPALRSWKWVAKDAAGNPVLMKGDVLVHPDRVKKLDALLGKSWWQINPVPRAVMKVSDTVKQTMLDVSVFHPVQIKAHSLEHRVGKLVDIDPMDPTQRALIEHSLTIFDHKGHQMFSEGLAGGSLTKHVPIAGPWLHGVHDFVFKEWIPKVKMTMALDALARNQKRYKGRLSDDDILYLTAKQSNAAFGFQNYRDMGMHPSYQDALRATLLAPDFLISRAQFVGQGIGTKYGKEQLEALALGALVLYTTARIGNQIASGEWRWDKPFEVVVGGRSFSIRSVQEDLFNAIKDTRKFIFGRINPVTTRTVAEALTGRDYAGRERGPLEQLGDIAKTPIPIAFRTEEQKKLWESMLAATGMVVKRASASQEIFKKAQEWKKEQGIEEPGEFIYDPKKDPYRKLKIALSIGNEDDAKKALKELKEDPATSKKVLAHMVSFYHRPFSGGMAREAKFKASLSADEKKLYADAKKEKAESLALFRRINQ